MPVTWIKRKYVVGATYSSQKSPAGNGGGKGKTNKKSNKRNKKIRELFGRKVMILNMSGVDKFCASTGKKLPTKGMVVEYEGKYYADFKASARAHG